jgi:hypothetical protein
MTILEALKKWENDTTVYIHYTREQRASEYNEGVADGMQTALDSLKSYLKDCTDYTLRGEK